MRTAKVDVSRTMEHFTFHLKIRRDYKYPFRLNICQEFSDGLFSINLRSKLAEKMLVELSLFPGTHYFDPKRLLKFPG